METERQYNLTPSFGDSFGTGWKVMFDNFLRLFLLIVIIGIIAAPFKMAHINVDPSHFHGAPWNWDHIVKFGTFGILAIFYGLFAMLYALLVAPVFQFGADFMFLQSVRRIKPDFETLIKGFTENYLSIILANLLVIALVVLGFFALIIPGIIIACRLVFVPYIIMDKKLDPIEAVEQSWKLTRGHGWTIFFMGFVSFFIIILGLCMIIVGVFPAIIWVWSSFASLYESLTKEKEKPADQFTEQTAQTV
jgi:uncharacterized membrane protein